MIEQEWLACADPIPMLRFLREKVSDRKLRLFALACCCRILRLLGDQRSVQALLVVDRYLDGAASPDEVGAAISSARSAYENAFQSSDSAAFSVTWLAAEGYEAARSAASSAAHAVGHELAAGSLSQNEVAEKNTAGRLAEQSQQAALLRHIVGNPFCPFPAPDHWPSTMFQLAYALSNGEDCSFALHDALLEAGHTEMAGHFRQEARHPKGCWALDLLTGRE
jgi:hypothetical protein